MKLGYIDRIEMIFNIFAFKDNINMFLDSHIILRNQSQSLTLSLCFANRNHWVSRVWSASSAAHGGHLGLLWITSK